MIANAQHCLPSFFTMSEGARDRFYALVAKGKTAIQYGWIPFIVMLGMLHVHLLILVCGLLVH